MSVLADGRSRLRQPTERLKDPTHVGQRDQESPPVPILIGKLRGPVPHGTVGLAEACCSALARSPWSKNNAPRKASAFRKFAAITTLRRSAESSSVRIVTDLLQSMESREGHRALSRSARRSSASSGRSRDSPRRMSTARMCAPLVRPPHVRADKPTAPESFRLGEQEAPIFRGCRGSSRARDAKISGPAAGLLGRGKVVQFALDLRDPEDAQAADQPEGRGAWPRRGRTPDRTAELRSELTLRRLQSRLVGQPLLGEPRMLSRRRPGVLAGLVHRLVVVGLGLRDFTSRDPALFTGDVPFLRYQDHARGQA